MSSSPPDVRGPRNTTAINDKIRMRRHLGWPLARAGLADTCRASKPADCGGSWVACRMSAHGTKHALSSARLKARNLADNRPPSLNAGWGWRSRPAWTGRTVGQRGRRGEHSRPTAPPGVSPPAAAILLSAPHRQISKFLFFELVVRQKLARNLFFVSTRCSRVPDRNPTLV